MGFLQIHVLLFVVLCKLKCNHTNTHTDRQRERERTVFVKQCPYFFFLHFHFTPSLHFFLLSFIVFTFFHSFAHVLRHFFLLCSFIFFSSDLVFRVLLLLLIDRDTEPSIDVRISAKKAHDQRCLKKDLTHTQTHICLSFVFPFLFT